MVLVARCWWLGEMGATPPPPAPTLARNATKYSHWEIDLGISRIERTAQPSTYGKTKVPSVLLVTDT